MLPRFFSFTCATFSVVTKACWRTSSIFSWQSITLTSSCACCHCISPPFISTCIPFGSLDLLSTLGKVFTCHLQGYTSGLHQCAPGPPLRIVSPAGDDAIRRLHPHRTSTNDIQEDSLTAINTLPPMTLIRERVKSDDVSAFCPVSQRDTELA